MNQTFEKSLPIPISEDEKLELCAVLGHDCVRKAELEEKKKEASSNYNEKIKFIQEDIDKNSKMAASGERYVMVKCQARPNPLDKTIEVFRLDFGDMVDSRPMTEEELAEIPMEFDEE